MVENQLKQMPGLTDTSMQESEKNRMQIEETKLRTSMEVKNHRFFTRSIEGRNLG
jgi:hypothetical protein